MVITDEQVQAYQRDGYTVVRSLITTGEAAAIRARLMEVFEGKHDWPLVHFQVLNPEQFRNQDDSLIPVGVQQPAQCEETFRTIADHPHLQSAMGQLLGGNVTRYTDQALIKHHDISGQSFYHQDSYYWRLDPQRGCNAWIALDEVGANASALAIRPGTHASWQLAEHEQYYDEPTFHTARNGDAFMRWRIPTNTYDASDETLLPMGPGDAAFFTNYTWHRSEPNRSGRDLCAYAIAYQLAD
jgi:ectoine hydroxylase-related dioxygenase (phytanoyl-CoA dioxygenase family)